MRQIARALTSNVPIALFALASMAVAQDAAQIRGHFADAPATSLIARLEPIGDGAAALAGLRVTQRCRWIPDPGLVVIDAEAINDGNEPIETTDAPVLELAFRLREREDDAGYARLTYRNDDWYDSTYWTGPGWTRVGKHWHHPGNDSPSIRCFRAPRDGRVTVTGRVYKLHLDGDGVLVMIRHGDTEVWRAEIEGKDGEGVEPKLALDVRKGDPIRFVCHKRKEIWCDTTGWDPIVTYADGERFQASEGFSTTKQGENNWYYEMCAESSATEQPPKVYAVGRDLCLRDMEVLPGQPFAANHETDLPFLVVADGAGESGIALALDPTSPWRAEAQATDDGLLRVALRAGAEEGKSLKPGDTRRLPRAVVTAFDGLWTTSLATLGQLVRADTGELKMTEFRRQVSAAHEAVTGRLVRRPNLDLLLMAQAEWHQEDQLAESVVSYAAATRKHLEKARALLADLRDGGGDGFLSREAGLLAAVTQQATGDDRDLDEWRRLYLQTRLLKRALALASPLLPKQVLFCKRVPTSYSHQVMQYYGFRARPGGGLYVLDDPGYSLGTRDVLGTQLPAGSILEPRLSYDGKRIVFSFVECPDSGYQPTTLAVNEEGKDEGYYHLYEVNVDGTGLRQLTSGPYDDLMPTYLPDGGIAFCSTRRRGYARCFGAQFSKRWDTYTLHRMDADGSNIRTLSYNDVNEWTPAVSNDGHLIYARWDYIDRDAVTHQNLWSMRPDGTNTMALWGNATPKPHCMFQAKAIPGSDKLVFTASAHHSITAGPICVLDPTVGDNDLAAITRVTGGVFPEAEGWNVPEYYTSPWPLSESHFLTAYCPTTLRREGQEPNARNALGLYLIDSAGNRELLYRDPAIGSDCPMPLAPRPKPPVVTTTAASSGAEPTGDMALIDVYEGLGDVPRGTIKELRVVQIFPKATPLANQPPIGLAGEENGRAILGTVPVEADGSAYFTVPANKAVLFQALDEDGFAYQTMRSLTYAQAGERTSCIGCHENRMSVPAGGTANAMALRRKPSKIDPGDLGGEPFSFVRVVQPILDQHCVKCHVAGKAPGTGPPVPKGIDLTRAPQGVYTKSYVSLCGDISFHGGGTNPENATKALVPRFGQRNQVQVTPVGGMYGARGSRLMKMLRKGHNDVKLSREELRRLATWIDLNAIFYGTNVPEEQAKQLAGQKIAMPEVQ